MQKLTVILLDQHDDPAFPHEGFYTMQGSLHHWSSAVPCAPRRRIVRRSSEKNGMQSCEEARRSRGASAKGKEEARRDDGEMSAFELKTFERARKRPRGERKSAYRSGSTRSVSAAQRRGLTEEKAQVPARSPSGNKRGQDEGAARGGSQGSRSFSG